MSLLCAAVLAPARPAAALVVNPFFTGHSTIDATTQVFDYRANMGFEYEPGMSQVDIDVAHGLVDDGGLNSRMTPGDWSVDFHVWGPLINDMDIQLGGVVTYGNPVPGVFAATWVGLTNVHDNSIHNTFQVVFVGTTGFHTNTGIEIAPGSVIFAYGSPADAHGTVHLSADTPAAIGILTSSLTTLAGFGIGDSVGVITTADVAALQASGDPFLFNKGAAGLEPPVAFDSVVELPPTTGVPEHAPQGSSLTVSPNPLRSATTIAYSLAQAGHVRLAIFDISGRRVASLADGDEPAGPHQQTWQARGSDGQRLATGLYLVRLAGDGFVSERKLLLVQ